MRGFLAAFGAPHVHRGGLELDRRPLQVAGASDFAVATMQQGPKKGPDFGFFSRGDALRLPR
jgi:hypothetical protein